MIGQTLDRYRIEAKLGQGGMGVVYKARDTQLDRIVAIKVLPSDKVGDPERKQRFIQEAKAASALNHPNIVTVYDVRSDAGIDFIVMEYAEGRTLDHMIPAKGLGIAQSLRYGAQIADALARAHEAGIVHRDLKPSNVIVTPGDRVKVLDFGLAKLLDPAGLAAEAATHASPITDAGMAVGTAAYMSPEQAEGKKVDARSDIFSFGAVLYEMLTGRRPFAADSRVAILAKILNDDPAPPTSINPALSSEVERAILRCLRKDPARRYQTMADLKVALEDFADDSASGHLTSAADVRPARRSPWRWAWVALIPLVIAAVYFALPRRQRPSAPIAPMQAVPLTAVPGVKRYPSFSPDGNHVTFTWTGPDRDNQDVYIQQIGAGTPLRLTTAEAPDHAPVWSPDGRSIAFLRATSDPAVQELRLIPPLGGAERKLTDIRPRGFLRQVVMDWCPDSRCVLLTDTQGGDWPDALFVVSTETGERRQLMTPPAGVLADTDPAISPDGRWLVFRRDISPFSGRLQVVALGNDLTVQGEPRPLTSVLLTAYGPKWISNEEILFYAKGALWRMHITAGSAPQRLPIGEDGLMPAISRPQANGAARLAYARSFADSNIWRIDTSAPGAPATNPPVLAIASTRRDGLAKLSADGRRITFTSDRSGELEIWVSDPDGANAVQLTTLGANPGYPNWAPDGQTVAFHSNAEDIPAGEIYLVSAQGGRVRNLTMHASATETFPSFSRDGKWLYFSSTRTGAPFIWKIPTAGGEAVKVSPAVGLFSVESTDGKFLYYVDSRTTNAAGPLLQQPVSGGPAVKLVDNVLTNSFDVIERGIYYLERVATETRLQYFDLTTRRSTTIASQLGSSPGVLSVSRNGRTIFFSRIDSTIDDLILVENFR